MGRRLDRGPSGFLGFCSAINVPLPRDSNTVCCSNIMLIHNNNNTGGILQQFGTDVVGTQGTSIVETSKCLCNFINCDWLIKWTGIANEWVQSFIRLIRILPCKPFTNGITLALIHSYTFAILGVNSQWWGTFGRFDGLNCFEHFVAVSS